MNSLREAMTQMSSTGQPLLTQKRWMVINKAIVFDNGIIPYTDDSGDGIISILSHLYTKDNKRLHWAQTQQNIKITEQEFRKVGVHNYYDFIMASWNNVNWVFHLHNIDSDERQLLQAISAYSLYLTSIGDVDKALDPMQWDYMTFWNWRWHNYQQFMVFDVFKFTPFGQSILPTPLLISSISKAKTTVSTTAPVVIQTITAPVVIRTKIVSTEKEISNEDKSNEDIVSNLDDVAVADDDVEIDNVNIHSNTVAVPTTASNIVSNEEVVTAREIRTDLNDVEIVSNEEVISNNSAEEGTNGVADAAEINRAKFQNSTVAITTTTPVFTDIESNEDIVPNLDVVAATDDNNGLNAKSPPRGDLDGIRDESYQVKRKCDSFYDGSDNINPPPLPPESPAYTTNIPCIHSSIPNDGERIVLPSSVSRVVKDNGEIVEGSRKYDLSRVVKDNGEIVEGSRKYHLKVISTEPENVSSNLDDVSATSTTTTTTDDINNEEFHSSTVAVPTTTITTVINMDGLSTKDVSSNVSVAAADDDNNIDNPHRTNIVSNEKVVSALELCTDLVSTANDEIDNGPTGATIMHEGVMFAQYSNCHHELYYESCEIYGDDPEDSEQAQSRLANSGEVTWDTIHSPSVGDDSEFQSDFLYDQFVIKRDQRLAYQGKLDKLEDLGITEAELHEAQAPLKPTVRRPESRDHVLKSEENANSNLKVVDIDAKYDIDNANLQVKYENSIGDLDGIQDVHSIMPNDGEILSLPLFSSEYRVEQAEHSYEVNTDNANSHSNTEIVPTATTITAPVICIVSNENVVISNLNVAAAATDNDDGIHSRDGEYLAPAATDDDDDIHSRDEEYPDEEEHHEELIGVLDGTRQDILNVGVLDGTRQVILNVESNIESNNYDDKHKERMLLPSSVSRLVKDDAVMINDEPVVESVEDTNETVVDSVEDTARDSLKKHAVSDSKKGSSPYRPQLKKEQKKKKGEWVNNKKVKWSVDTKPPSLPTHLLPSPKLDTRSERIPSAITAEIKTYLERAQDETTNSNGDDNCDLNNNTVQVEDVPDDNVDDDADYGEHNNFNYVDIGKEILQFKHEDLTGESETIIFYDCYDVEATQQEVGKYSIKKLYDDSILNVKLQVECENSTGDLNGIQRDYPIVNEVISESDDANPPPLPPEHPPSPSIMLHDASFNAPDPHDYLDSICSNTELLKRAHSSRAHSPQGTLSLVDPIVCCVMKRKDGECPDPEVKLYHRGAYQLYLEQPAGKMEYVWGDDESMINSPTVPEDRSSKRNNILSFHYVKSMLSWRYINMQLIVPKWIFSDILTKHWSYQSSYHELIHPVFQHAGNTAAMFPDETLEVDASIEKGTIFGILGSEKRSEKPMNRIHVCGQTIVETSMYTTVRRLLLVQ